MTQLCFSTNSDAKHKLNKIDGCVKDIRLDLTWLSLVLRKNRRPTSGSKYRECLTFRVVSVQDIDAGADWRASFLFINKYKRHEGLKQWTETKTLTISQTQTGPNRTKLKTPVSHWTHPWDEAAPPIKIKALRQT